MVTVNIKGRASTAHEGQWIFPGTQDGWHTFRPGSVILSIHFCAHWETGKPLFDHQDVIILQSDAERELTQAGENLQTIISRFSTGESFFRFNQTITTADRHFSIQHAFYNWICAYINTMHNTGREPSIMALVDRRVLQAVRLIEHDPLRFSHSEAELARAVGLGVRYLNRLFVKEIQVTPKQYINRRRLQEAVFLLEYHQRSVKEVAYELGFCSPSHFSVWFTRHKDISPRLFKKTHSH